VSLTGLAFFAAFIGGCLLALARHPVYGLVTYVGVFYLHPPSRWWGEGLPDLRWSLLAALVTLAASFIHRSKINPSPFFRHPVVLGLLAFLMWIGLQTLWALDHEKHAELVLVYAKYLLLVGLMYKCIDTVAHLRMMVWTHILGCLYLGVIVMEQYLGGRFEGFGGPDINEANSGALQVVTGIAAAAALFLAGSMRQKLVMFLMVPLIVNALVATQSRSGFLALVVAGLVFNVLAPKKYVARVRILSVLALVLLILVTNPLFWSRMGTITHVGQKIEGVDTAAGRMPIIQAQWRMFNTHPMGCGHRCTATLIRQNLDDIHLTKTDDMPARSSHNTFMTMLVEQGIPGALFYIVATAWILRKISALRRSLSGRDDFLASIYTAIAASLIALLVGDLFVDYLKLEVRVWFLAFLMVIAKLTATEKEPQRGGREALPASSAGRQVPNSGVRGRGGTRV
jgi:O-antigen ligase